MLIKWIELAIKRFGGSQSKLADAMLGLGFSTFKRGTINKMLSKSTEPRALRADEMLAMAALAKIPLPMTDEKGTPIPLWEEDKLPAQFARLLASDQDALKEEVANFIAFRLNAASGGSEQSGSEDSLRIETQEMLPALFQAGSIFPPSTASEPSLPPPRAESDKRRASPKRKSPDSGRS
jgi:hypothetical protein